MSSNDNNHTSSAAAWLATFSAVLFLYVLSPPAVGVLIKQGVVSKHAKWLMIYAPIGLAADNVPLVRRFYDWLFTKTGAAGF